MIASEETPVLQLPYATIEYEMVHLHKDDRLPTIDMFIEYAVNMDDAINAVEV